METEVRGRRQEEREGAEGNPRAKRPLGPCIQKIDGQTLVY